MIAPSCARHHLRDGELGGRDGGGSGPVRRDAGGAPPDASAPPDEDGGEPSWTGSGFGFVWSSGGAVRFVRLDEAGVRVGGEVALGPGERVDLAWGGDGFAVAIHDGHDSQSHLRLADDGRPIGSRTTVCCSGGGASRISGDPAVAAHPGGSTMVWADPTLFSRPLQLSRFGATGTLLGTTAISRAGWTLHPDVASGPGEVGVVFRNDAGGELGVHFARADSLTGHLLAPDRPVRGGHEILGCDDTDRTSIVRTETGYAVSWSARAVDGTPRLWFAHVCPGGS